MRTLPLRFWLSLTLSLLVLVPAGARAADPIRIWVDNALTIDDSESADGVASCPALATPPTTQTVNAGTSSRKRLRGVQTASGYMYGLNYALKCIHDTRDWDTRDVEVYVVCKNGGKVANDPLENPNAKPRCEYSNLDNTLNPLLFGHTPSSTRPAVTGKRLLRAEPEDSVKLALHTTIRVYDNWTIQGVRFDGSRVPDGGAQSTTWINLLGSNIRFERNSVIEMRGSCIRVGDNVYNSIPKNVTLAYNHVEGCYARPLNHEDRHCIFTYQADNLNVLFNEMTRCQGDGFQTLNHEQPTPAELAGATDAGVRKANFNTVATGTRVVGNRIWTSCQNYKGPDGVERGYTLGENAIDIKRTGLGLLIQDNLMHGFRSSGATDCPSFTETTSYLNGSAIVMHGTIENDSAAQVDWQTAALNPECTLAERDDAGTRCAVVEGNDIAAWFSAQLADLSGV